MQDVLKSALKDGSLEVPAAFAEQREQIATVLRKLAGRLEVKNADERKTVRTRQAVLQSPEFKALWDRIKHKTTYRVAFDNEKLISELHRGRAEGAANYQGAPAMAQGRHCHRQGRRRGDREEGCRQRDAG